MIPFMAVDNIYSLQVYNLPANNDNACSTGQYKSDSFM